MKYIITESQYRLLLELEDPGGEVGHFVDFPIDDNISLEVWEDKDRLEVASIVVPRNLRGQGIGTKIMTMVTDYADEKEKPIYLTADTSFGGTSVNRLIRFYKRFGFQKNDNQAVRHTMVRYPNI